MRILHTEWSDGWGGQEGRIVSEMVGMRERGHTVWLATRPSARIGAEAERHGMPVIRVPFRSAFDLATARALRHLIRRERIDVVNTHSGKDSWTGGLAARTAGARLVRTRHLDIPIRRSPANFVHYLPQRVVACGEAMRERLVREDGFPAPMVTNIPTGIDFARLAPTRGRAAVRAELGVGDGDFVVLMVGVIRSIPQAVTQALGAGVAVVATRVGGVPELVRDGRTGLLAEADDVDALGRHLLRLAAAPDLRRRLGEAGRAHVRSRFSLDAMLDATERLYRELVSAR